MAKKTLHFDAGRFQHRHTRSWRSPAALRSSGFYACALTPSRMSPCQEPGRRQAASASTRLGVRVPHGIRSEALECVQLAAAFLPASLLAGITKLFPFQLGFLCVPARVPASKQAGAKAAASCAHSKASLPKLKRSLRILGEWVPRMSRGAIPVRPESLRGFSSSGIDRMASTCRDLIALLYAIM
jgi:hypothetical protein